MGGDSLEAQIQFDSDRSILEDWGWKITGTTVGDARKGSMVSPIVLLSPLGLLLPLIALPWTWPRGEYTVRAQCTREQRIGSHSTTALHAVANRPTDQPTRRTANVLMPG